MIAVSPLGKEWETACYVIDTSVALVSKSKGINAQS